MQPTELEAAVKEALSLARENNEILKRMQRNARMRFWVNLIFWAVIIIGSGYATYALVDQLLNSFGGSSASSAALQNLLQQYQGQ